MSFLDNFADELKRRNVEVLPPILVTGDGKIGMQATHQCTTEDEECYKELLDRCLAVSPSKLQFVELVLPSDHVEQAVILVRDNVVLRYIKFIDVRSDEPVERWDALIKV